MKEKDLISSILLLGFSSAFLIEALKLPLGSLRTPQPGLWPLILALILAIFSLILLVQTLIEKTGRKSSLWARPGSWKRIGLSAGSLFAFVVVFEYLGHLISIFLLIAFLMRAIEPQKWWLVILVGFSSSLFCYLVFVLLLNIPLPQGILGI